MIFDFAVHCIALLTFARAFIHIYQFDLNKKYGKGYIDNVLLTVVNYWFKKTYKLEVKEVE